MGVSTQTTSNTQSTTQRLSDASTIQSMAHASMLTFGKYLTNPTDAAAFILGFGLHGGEAPPSYFPHVNRYMPIFAKQEGNLIKLMTQDTTLSKWTTLSKVEGEFYPGFSKIHHWGQWILFADNSNNPIYNCEDKSWVNSMDTKVLDDAAISVYNQESLMVIGGRTTNHAATLFKSKVNVSDLVEVQLPSLTQLLSKSVHGILNLDNVETLIVAGGRGEGGLSSDCETIPANSSEGTEWTSCPQLLPYSAESLSSVVWKNVLVTLLFNHLDKFELFSYDGSVWEKVMDGLTELPGEDGLFIDSFLYLKNTQGLCVTTRDHHEFCLKEVGGDWMNDGIVYNVDDGIHLIGSLNFFDMKRCFPVASAEDS